MKRLKSIWKGMKYRCLPDKGHKNYGKRGIRVCKKWIDSFEEFEVWALNNGYKDTLQIDRKDNDGNYTPGNCRWATSIEHSANRSIT